MATYCIGCDNINGGESGYINKMASAFQEAGHTVEKLGVGPNVVQSKGGSSSSSGKIGVYIVGGSDIGTYVDFKAGLERGYYHYKYVWFAFASWTAHSWITCEDLKNKALVRAHDDNFSSQSSIQPYIGKSADYFFSQNKSIMNYVCGQSPEELAKKILGGGGDSGDGEGESSASSIKEALKKAVSGWDGDVEINVIGDTVYVNKIHNPVETDLLVNEFENVIYDSVTITDLNPQTPNIATMNYQGKNLELRDDIAINRFGEIPIEVSPDGFVQSYDDAVAYLQRIWNKIHRDDARQIELKVMGDIKWKTGVWSRVYLPSFYIDEYMYIIRVSHDEDGTNNWTANLTFVDYPPSFGTYEEEEEVEDEESEEDVDLEE